MTTRKRKRTTKTTSNSTRAAGRRQRGVALILVLWTLAALAVLAAEFARAMHDEAASTRNFKESTHGRLVALAGINEVILALKARREAPEDQIESQNDIDNPDQVRSLSQGDGQWVKATFRGNPYEVRVLDEAGRIPLNSSKTDANLLRLVFDHLEIDESEAEIIADSIIDWRDEDDLHQPNGAESEYYEGLERPYAAKNASFDTVEELLLVRGVTREIFYGHDGIPGLREIFSVFNKKAVDPRTMPPAVIRALTGLESDEANEFAVNRRGSGGDAALQQLKDTLAAAGVTSKATGEPKPVEMTIEARVFDATGQVVLSHIGAELHLSGDGDGLKLNRWYDSIFDESDRSGAATAAADTENSQG